jgi:tetratricopeptide (TPR) repeat protein
LADIDLEYGPHTVGFAHYTATDSTRTYIRSQDWTNEHIFRPIPISVWYPSNDDVSAKTPLNVLDYMRIFKQEEEWEYLPDEQILNWFQYPNTPSNRSHLLESTKAFYNSKMENQEFPVVVYAPSYQASSIENFALCEYLASLGYFVIASPSRGDENRFFEGGTAKDMETQARDIEFLIKESQKYTGASTTQLATMDYSFGGLAQVLTQMRNDKIKAIVSLDGSIKYQYETLRKSPFCNIDKVKVPFIHFSQKAIPESVLIEDKIDPSLNTDFEFYDSLTYSDAYHFTFHNMTHSYFSTLGVLFEPRDPRQDKSDAEIMASYRLVSIYTKNFLDGYLKNDSIAYRFLQKQPDQQITERGIITKESKKALKKDLTFQDFNDKAASRNYIDMAGLYDSLASQNPTININEGQLNSLGLQLIFNPAKSAIGIKVFLFAIEMFPQSANLWDSLGEAYWHVKDYPNAKSSFEQSLKLNPENENANKRLVHLKSRGK